MTALRIIALALALYVMWWTGPTAHRFAAAARGEARRLDKLAVLLLNLDGAMAMVDLWLVDPVRADAIAADCRKLAAEGINHGA